MALPTADVLTLVRFSYATTGSMRLLELTLLSQIKLGSVS